MLADRWPTPDTIDADALATLADRWPHHRCRDAGSTATRWQSGCRPPDTIDAAPMRWPCRARPDAATRWQSDRWPTLAKLRQSDRWPFA